MWNFQGTNRFLRGGFDPQIINIFNEEGNDITKLYNTVVFEINRKGIKEFATMLFVWANNCKVGDEYLMAKINSSQIGYNLGVLLTQDSITTSFACDNLGTAYDYDSRIWVVKF